MRQDNNSEKKLIALAKEGDMEAFESLVRKYQKSIYYLCHRMTDAHQSADDLSKPTSGKSYWEKRRAEFRITPHQPTGSCHRTSSREIG
jgi:hypothetical protein